MYSSSQVAAAMKEMGKAGMGFREVMENINHAVTLGGATDVELAQSADAMIAIMMQWRLPFTKSREIADMMAYAVNASVIEMGDLSEAMKYAGATAIDTGARIEEVTAMVMALGQAGLKGSMAGVAVENALRYMGRAIGTFGTSQQREALQFLGMTMEDVQDAAGNVRPMTEVFQNFAKALERTYGPEMGIEKQGILSEIFGVRGKRAASLLIRNLSQMKDFVKAVNEKSPGMALRITEKRMNSFSGQIQRMGHQWQIVWQNMAEALEPIGRVIMTVLRGIGQAMSFLFSGWKGTVFAAAIAGFIAIKTVALAYKAVLAGITLMNREIGGSTMAMSNLVIRAYARMTLSAKTYQAAVMGGVGATVMTRFGAIGSKDRWGYSSRAFAGKGGYYVNVPGGAWRTFRTAEKASTFAKSAYGLGALGSIGLTNRFRAAAAGAGALAGGAATGVLGRLVSILGGPWGIALAFILPAAINALIRAINRNKDSVAENSRELQKQNLQKELEEFKYTRMWHMLKFTDINAPSLKVIGTTSTDLIEKQLTKVQLEDFTNKLKEQLTNPIPSDTTITINLDGDSILSDKILNLINKQNQKTALKFGF